MRTGAHILEIFGSVVLLLAVIGLYASLTLRMILGEGLKVTMVGIAAGLLPAVGLGKLLAGFLYDIRSLDPLVLSSAPVLLALVALLACYIPPAERRELTR